MKKFSVFTALQEEKNVHMEHLEDLIFNEGVDGTRRAINFLRDLRDMLAGHTTEAVDVTVKWDGAPAIFAGVDPADNKFFVAKKGLFNKQPAMYKTQSNIDEALSGELHKKFSIALTEFAKLGLTKGVYQGDLMFTRSDLKVQMIEGEKYITFQPNTIVYAVPLNSHLGKVIGEARIGAVWHTTYSGKSITEMSATFGESIVPKMNPVSTIWMDDATYKDVSGKATLTVEETSHLNSILSRAGVLFNQVDGRYVDGLAEDDETLTRLKVFNNNKIREGQLIESPSDHVNELVDYMYMWFQKQIDEKKTNKGKCVWENKQKVAMNYLRDKNQLMTIFTLANTIIEAKNIIIKKLNSAGHMKTFLRTRNGLRVTNVEGFVAIDHVGKAIKIVDRMEFSQSNFSPEILKGWDH